MSGPRLRRRATPPIVLVALDATSALPLHRQVYEGMRESILACRLPPGTRLPSTRSLAAELGVARNTVAQAYDQLRVEGYITGRRGGGTWVRPTLPDRLLTVPRRVAGAGVGRPEPKRAAAVPPAETGSAAGGLSKRGARLVRAASGFLGVLGEAPVPFHVGVPALDTFPRRVWSRLSNRQWRDGGVRLADLDAAGDPVLRDVVATYISNARGARCTADQVLIVNGTQQALDLVTRVLLDAGDAVWLEDPGYFGARIAFESGGARIVPVPVDAEGMDVAAGERLEATARLAYVTPSHQFPLGVVMSLTRRLALLSWARRTSAWVLEDDYDSEFRYAGRPLQCLQGVEAEQRAAGESARVLYVGTFSKTLAPGLRLGYLVVPDLLIDAFRAARSASDRHAPTFLQAVLADFIADGHYARHLRRVRSLYAERQAVLLDAARARLGGLIELADDPAGLHLVGRLERGLDEAAAVAAAAAADVVVSPLTRHTLRVLSSAADGRGALLLGYAGFDPMQLRSAVERLREALVSLRPGRGTP